MIFVYIGIGKNLDVIKMWINLKKIFFNNNTIFSKKFYGVEKFIYLFLFNVCFILSKGANTTIVFHLNNADSSYYAHFTGDYINDSIGNEILYIDTVLTDLDSFEINLLEPIPILYMPNNDISKKFVFYSYPGRILIDIDIQNPRNSKVYNSSLNDEYLKNKKEDDSINNLVFTPYILKKMKENYSIGLEDSLQQSYNAQIKNIAKTRYNTYIKRTNNSYLVLNFISHYLTDKSIFSIRKLKKLFNTLDTNMESYPTYISCKERLHRSKKSKKINEPFFNPYKTAKM